MRFLEYINKPEYPHVKLRKWSVKTAKKQYELDLTNKVIDTYDSGKIENKDLKFLIFKKQS